MPVSPAQLTLRRSRLRSSFIIVACLLFVSASVRAEVQKAAPKEGRDTKPSASVDSLLKQLSSDDFADRASAQKGLSQLAHEDPQQFVDAFPQADPEARIRFVQLLEGIFLNCDNERGDRAEKALEELKQLGSVAAESVLFGNSRLRESRARRVIMRLGGQLTYVHPTDYRTLSVAPLMGVGFGEPAVLNSILIPEDWQGTPEDLWQIRRLSHHTNLTLFNIRGSNVREEDLWQLVSAMPGLMVAERGACLGIKATPGATTAEVSEVVENSAAAAAGMLPADKIEKLGGERVRNFAHLVELLMQYTPGDSVVIQVRRNGVLLDIPVELGSWKSMPQSESRAVPPPAPFPGPLGIGTPPPPSPPVPAPSPRRHLQFN